MTQNLFLYWQRLTQARLTQTRGAGDGRVEAPVLDLAGCFGSPIMRGPIVEAHVIKAEAIVAGLAEAAQTRPAPR